jgi:hypothetical protein
MKACGGTGFGVEVTSVGEDVAVTILQSVVPG